MLQGFWGSSDFIPKRDDACEQQLLKVSHHFLMKFAREKRAPGPPGESPRLASFAWLNFHSHTLLPAKRLHHVPGDPAAGDRAGSPVPFLPLERR